MLERKIDNQYEEHREVITPGNSDILGNESMGLKGGILESIFVIGAIVIVGGTYYVIDKTSRIYNKIFKRK